MRVTGEHISVGLVFKVVSSTQEYNTSDDIMVGSGCIGQSDIVNGMMELYMYTIYCSHLKLYNTIMY